MCLVVILYVHILCGSEETVFRFDHLFNFELCVVKETDRFKESALQASDPVDPAGICTTFLASKREGTSGID